MHKSNLVPRAADATQCCYFPRCCGKCWLSPVAWAVRFRVQVRLQCMRLCLAMRFSANSMLTFSFTDLSSKETRASCTGLQSVQAKQNYLSCNKSVITATIALCENQLKSLGDVLLLSVRHKRLQIHSRVLTSGHPHSAYTKVFEVPPLQLSLVWSPQCNAFYTWRHGFNFQVCVLKCKIADSQQG